MSLEETINTLNTRLESMESVLVKLTDTLVAGISEKTETAATTDGNAAKKLAVVKPTASVTDIKEEKPTRKRRGRPAAAKTAEVAEAAETAEADKPVAEEKPKRRRVRRKAAEVVKEVAPAPVAEAKPEPEPEKLTVDFPLLREQFSKCVKLDGEAPKQILSAMGYERLSAVPQEKWDEAYARTQEYLEYA